jgi:hypothetical protein
LHAYIISPDARAKKELQQAERIRIAEEKLREADRRTHAAQEKLRDAQQRSLALEEKLREADLGTIATQERLREAEQRTLAVEERLREAEQRTLAAQKKLREAELKALAGEEKPPDTGQGRLPIKDSPSNESKAGPSPKSNTDVIKDVIAEVDPELIFEVAKGLLGHFLGTPPSTTTRKSGKVQVGGYTRRDGTRVAPYDRSYPGKSTNK